MIDSIHYERLVDNGIKIYENKEALMLYFENDFISENASDIVTIKADSYIALEKQFYYDCFSNSVHRSTKGNFNRCKKAFEKYSENTMKALKEKAG